MTEHYWFRALAMAFASFALSYSIVSGISSLVWVCIRERDVRSSNVLFGILAAPLLLSAAIVSLLVMPAFVVFEPPTEEAIRWELCAFAIVGLGIVVAAICRGFSSWLKMARSVRRWSAGATSSYLSANLPIFTTEKPSPVALVAGVFHPKLLISRSATRTLTSNELRLVIAHEVEHARRRDNLRKLLLAASFTPFRREIEERWLLASELAADRGAVANGYDACDLAAALVKVSRITAAQPRLAAQFAAPTPAALEMRVQQLITWEPSKENRQNWLTSDALIYAIAGAALTLLIFSGDLLRLVHRISELWMN